MTSRTGSVAIVGAGIFGVTSAIELRRRGYEVTLADVGPVPCPDASSTDVSKAVRMDYGSDALYADLAERSLDGWREWNHAWSDPPYHEDGILLLSTESLDQGGFEAASFRMLSDRGLPLERLDRSGIAERFPAWSHACYPEGYFNPVAGWAESGRVVGHLKDEALDLGVRLVEQTRCERLHERGSRVVGVVLADGSRIDADFVLVAAGAWTGFLLENLSQVLWATGQPVAHFRLDDPRPFEAPRFSVWCADIANTGWYGFPINREGTLKVGHHGPGRRFHRGDPQVVQPDEKRRFVEFVARTFPDADGARIVSTRLCLYCDTWDGNFLIDHDPDRPGLVVAAGGSGHGFKFAPILGRLIANVLEGNPDPASSRFAWRVPEGREWEQARHPGRQD